MINLGIRVASDAKLGKGHLERCLSIRSHFKGNVFWFFDSKNINILNKISKRDQIFFEGGSKDYSKLKLKVSKNMIDLVLLDTYEINLKNFNSEIGNIPIAYIADNYTKEIFDILISPQPFLIKKSNSRMLLSGLKYAPISKKIYNFKNLKRGNKLNILLSMGAFDSFGMTLVAISSIKKLIRLGLDFNVRIVLGEKSPIINEVKQAIINDNKFKLFVGTKKMNYLYNYTDIALGAPGLSQFERMLIGIPTILIAQNKHHKILLKNWKKLGAAIIADNNIDSIKIKLHELINNTALRNKIKSINKSLIDGNGAKRIADTIYKSNK